MNEEHKKLVRGGAAAINAWRVANPATLLELSRLDLVATVGDAECDLKGALLAPARLDHANLSGANLTRVDLGGCSLQYSNLSQCLMYETCLDGANLQGADITGVWFKQVQYTTRGMHGCYLGIRGLGTCSGDPLFRRDAADQEYIDAHEALAERHLFSRLLCRGWRVFDYGRSLARVAAFALIVVVAFGCVYARFPELLSKPPTRSYTSLSPFYFSMVTLTTVGFGDFVPSDTVGEALVMLEILIGYITLGLLLAVLSQKFGRRA